MSGWLHAPKVWARGIEREVAAPWAPARGPRMTVEAKIAPGAAAAFAPSPLGLIPDFVPVPGTLDDLLIVPPGIVLAVGLINPLP